MDIKERIIENSLELFMNRGCKSVTMDDVAGENGVSKRTLYEFFKDKSTLLQDILVLYENKMRKMFYDISMTSDNILEQFFQLHDRQSELSINLRIIFFAELKKFYPEIYNTVVKKMVCTHDNVIKDGIIKGQQQGLFCKNLNVDIVSKVMGELGSIMENQQLFPLNQFERKAVFREIFINYLRGISTLKGIEIIDNYLNK